MIKHNLIYFPWHRVQLHRAQKNNKNQMNRLLCRYFRCHFFDLHVAHSATKCSLPINEISFYLCKCLVFRCHFSFCFKQQQKIVDKSSTFWMNARQSCLSFLVKNAVTFHQTLFYDFSDFTITSLRIRMSRYEGIQQKNWVCSKKLYRKDTFSSNLSTNSMPKALFLYIRV